MPRKYLSLPRRVPSDIATTHADLERLAEPSTPPTSDRASPVPSEHPPQSHCFSPSPWPRASLKPSTPPLRPAIVHLQFRDNITLSPIAFRLPIGHAHR